MENIHQVGFDVLNLQILFKTMFNMNMSFDYEYCYNCILKPHV
jgi:hypothetical protein